MSPTTADARFRQRCDALGAQLRTLPDKPEETADATLAVLWQAAAGKAMSAAAAPHEPLPALDAQGEARLDALIAQRLSGTPLAHLSGRQRFMGLDMLAGPQALIPRAETELLGHAALSLLREMPGPELRVIDVCTGSGNLALALAHHEPRARLFAADLSQDAVALAQRNAVHLRLDRQVQWRSGDLLEPFDEAAFHGCIDLLVCNPPYISSTKVDEMDPEISGHEPRLAFDAGPLGVRILQRLVREAPRYLKPGGWLAFEVGHGQGPAVHKRLQASGLYRELRGVADAQGETRVLLAAT